MPGKRRRKSSESYTREARFVRGEEEEEFGFVPVLGSMREEENVTI